MPCWHRGVFQPPSRPGFVQFTAGGWGAFAALNKDGTVSFWGGAVPSRIPTFLNKGFVSISANGDTFAALRADGSIETWQVLTERDLGAPTDKGYVELIPLSDAFAALKPDGSIVMWGDKSGWAVPAPTDKGYTKILTIGTYHSQSFIGLKKDGSISVWGVVPNAPDSLTMDSGYLQILSTSNSVFALKKDGSIAAWTPYGSGGNESPKDKGYTKVFKAFRTFIGLKSDGSLSGWGNDFMGAATPPSGKGFVYVVGGEASFTAMRSDGSLISWGYLGNGVQSAPAGTGFSQLFATGYGYSALKADGTISSWGGSLYGGTGAPTGNGFVSIATPLASAPWFSSNTESHLFAKAGAAIRYQIPAQGTPFPNFRLSKGNLPTGVTLDSKTGLISGLPSPKQSGSFAFSVTLDNGFGAVTKDFSLSFTAVPTLAPAKATFEVGSEGSYIFTLGKTTTPFHYQLLANGQALPKGLQWDSNSGQISGSPILGQGGKYQFTVTLTNWVSSFTSQPFALTVNEAPQFKNTKHVEFYAAQGNTFTIMPIGYPKPILGITGGALPKGVALDLKTGFLTGTPGPGTAGTYSISLSLSNGTGQLAKQTITLFVRNALSPNSDRHTDPTHSNSTIYNFGAFAVLRDDGSIAAWGNRDNGGFGAPTDKGYIQIFSTGYGFAALKSDGSISAWGKAGLGLEMAPPGGGFTAIYSNAFAFAALRTDGSIATWGDPRFGGSGAPTDSGFTQIVAKNQGFSALKKDGSIRSWGASPTTFTPPPADKGYIRLFANQEAFAALKSDGSIRVWGNPTYGGSNGPKGNGFIQIYSNVSGFSALRNDGVIYIWGNRSDSVGATSEPGFTRILPSSGGFLAIKSDGTARQLFTQSYFDFNENGFSEFFQYIGSFVGLNSDGQFYGSGSQVYPIPTDNGFISIRSNQNAFAALKKDGSIVTGGDANYGGIGGPNDKGYVSIFSTVGAFAAIKADGSLFSWGNANYGGTGAPTGQGYNSFAWPLEQSPWFTFETKSMLTANINETFSFTPPVRGLPTPTFSIDQGSLPPGITLNNQTGLLSGKPSRVGAYSFTIGASNGADFVTTKEFTIQVVQPVNDPPAGADKTISLLEDQAYILKEADFGFADPLDTPANTLASVLIASLPAKGSLTLAGKVIVEGQFAPIADIRAGKLVYKPAANGVGDAYASFTFRNRDNGGTKFGGVDVAVNANRINFTVTAVNDAPSGSNKALNISKSAPFILTLADFGFTDTKDPEPNALNRVQFVTVPASGKGLLTFNGSVLKANAFVTAADIAAGKLKYSLPSTEKGKAFATISFKVEDDGGTANGGKNLALTASSFTINVA